MFIYSPFFSLPSSIPSSSFPHPFGRIHLFHQHFQSMLSLSYLFSFTDYSFILLFMFIIINIIVIIPLTLCILTSSFHHHNTLNSLRPHLFVQPYQQVCVHLVTVNAHLLPIFFSLFHLPSSFRSHPFMFHQHFQCMLSLSYRFSFTDYSFIFLFMFIDWTWLPLTLSFWKYTSSHCWHEQQFNLVYPRIGFIVCQHQEINTNSRSKNWFGSIFSFTLLLLSLCEMYIAWLSCSFANSLFFSPYHAYRRCTTQTRYTIDGIVLLTSHFVGSNTFIGRETTFILIVLERQIAFVFATPAATPEPFLKHIPSLLLTRHRCWNQCFGTLSITSTRFVFLAMTASNSDCSLFQALALFSKHKHSSLPLCMSTAKLMLWCVSSCRNTA